MYHLHGICMYIYIAGIYMYLPTCGGFERWVQVFPELTYPFANDR